MARATTTLVALVCALALAGQMSWAAPLAGDEAQQPSHPYELCVDPMSDEYPGAQFCQAYLEGFEAAVRDMAPEDNTRAVDANGNPMERRFVSIFTDAASAIASAATDVASDVKSGVDTMGDAFDSLGSTVEHAAESAGNAVAASAKSAAESAYEGIEDAGEWLEKHGCMISLTGLCSAGVGAMLAEPDTEAELTTLQTIAATSEKVAKSMAKSAVGMALSEAIVALSGGELPKPAATAMVKAMLVSGNPQLWIMSELCSDIAHAVCSAL